METHSDKSWNIAYLTVATNKYVKYWENMVNSADEKFNQEDKAVFLVLTDQPDICLQVAKRLKNIEVIVTEIAPLGWPAATLLRYKLYSEHGKSVEAESFAHIDADMLFIQNPLNFTNPHDWQNGIALVEHPGYSRRPNIPIPVAQQVKDLIRRIRMGALGTWETNKKSKAFVRRKSRKSYVCGGSWMGSKDSFFDLVETLMDLTESDLEKELIAKWHDESYLNHWASGNAHTLLPSSFCFDASFPWLSGQNEIIRAVRKSVSVE